MAVAPLTAVGVIGYTAAPSGRLEVIDDPVGRAQAAFSTSLVSSRSPATPSAR